MIRAWHWWLIMAIVVVAALVLTRRAGQQISSPQFVAVGAAPAAPTFAPPTRSTAPPQATPATSPVTGSWSVTLPIEPEPTATWPPPPPPPTPTVTSAPTRCVTAESSFYQAFGPQPHVVVEVELINRCRRDLEPLDIWVCVQGWRQGGLVQQVKGHPFSRLYAGGRQRFGLGLPGSQDWYDEIRVEVEEPSAP